MVNVVFLWTHCGEMRGKRGHLNVIFRDPKSRHLFQVYFRRPNEKRSQLLIQIEVSQRSLGERSLFGLLHRLGKLLRHHIVVVLLSVYALLED